MTLLLDTHVWIWSQEAPEKLGELTTRLLTDRQNVLYVSTTSTLEIARLLMVGTVALSEPLTSWVSETLRALECGTMEISHQIAIEAYSLPGNFHKDPADRILVATARIYDLTLVTMDERILQYSHVTSQDARL
ncbi:MAG: type II toxin-antitoxin system VapC family toxin [Acidobacteriota bacterium]